MGHKIININYERKKLYLLLLKMLLLLLKRHCERLRKDIWKQKSHRRFILSIFQENVQFSAKANSTFKWATKWLDRYLTKGRHMAQKNAHCNQGKEIKIKFKNCYVPIRMAEPRQEHLEQSTGSHSGGSVKWHNYSEEHSGSFLRSWPYTHCLTRSLHS